MTAIDSFDLVDEAGQRIGRIEGSRGDRGEPVVRIVTTQGQLVCQLTGGEVARLAQLLGTLKAVRR